MTDNEAQEADAQRVDRLEAENERLREAVAFFASIIKSGEPWTEECEKAYRRALEPETEE